MLSTDNRAELGDILTDIGDYLDDNPPALSLPPAAYTSSELWQLERERIFNRSWMLVAHVDQLAKTGDYVTVSVAGEPVMVVRDVDGQLHALSPICRHRLMLMVEPGAGRIDTLTCQYHLWRYGLDGRLRGAPHMAANLDFNRRECRLPQFAVATWNGLVWINLDADAEPIAAHLDLTDDEFAGYRLGEMVQVESWSHEWRANWKVAAENGHENYHVLGLHRQTLEPFVPGGGDLDVRQYSRWALRLRVPFTVPVEAKSLQLNEVQKSNLVVLWTFPNSALAIAGERVVWFGFIPQSIDRVQVLGGVLTTPELAADAAATAQTSQFVMAMINDEDRLGLEAVQVGAGSRFAERGHLSSKEWPGMLAFYGTSPWRWLATTQVPASLAGMPRQAGRWSPTALRILGAAAELIALRGYSSTSTRDIAAAVGVEQPAIYKHFSAKRDILAALVRLAVEWPLELFGHITAMPVPAVVKLHRWLTESLDHLHASPYVLVSILITPDLHQESFVAERELVAEMERALVGLIETGQGEGDVRAMHPLSAARLVQALFDALALPEFAVSPDEIVEFAMTALLSDPDRLAEIRAAADALEIQTAPPDRGL